MFRVMKDIYTFECFYTLNQSGLYVGFEIVHCLCLLVFCQAVVILLVFKNYIHNTFLFAQLLPNEKPWFCKNSQSCVFLSVF